MKTEKLVDKSNPYWRWHTQWWKQENIQILFLMALVAIVSMLIILPLA